MIRRFLAWVNRRLNIIETDPEKNAYYDWADRWLDEQERP